MSKVLWELGYIFCNYRLDFFIFKILFLMFMVDLFLVYRYLLLFGF